MNTAADTLNDGWLDPARGGSQEDRDTVPLVRGDTVLYCSEGEGRTPAVLIAPQGGGWLARGARLLPQRIYLDAKSIVQRLPRNELAEEAA